MSSEKTEGKNPILPIFAVVFLDMVGVGIVIPIISQLFFGKATPFFGADVSEGARAIIFGVLVAAYPLAQFFGSPILGGLSDHYGRKKLLLASIAGTMVGYAIFAYGIITGNLALLFVGRVIDGFTGGNISIALSSIADVSDEKEKVRNFGLIGMAFGFGFIIGPAAGGMLSDPNIMPWFTLATPFVAAALLSAANLALIWVGFAETLKARVHTKVDAWMGFRNIRKAFEMEKLRDMFVIVFLLTFGFSLHAQFFPVFLIEKHGFDQAQVGYMLAWLGVCVAIVQGLVVRPLSKIYKPEKILQFSAPLLACAVVMVLVPHDAWWIYGIVPFIALFQGLTQPNSNAIVSNLGAKESQGEIMGINQSVQALGQAIPPLIAGVFLAVDYRIPIGLAAVALIGAWALFVWVFLPAKKEIFHEV